MIFSILALGFAAPSATWYVDATAAAPGLGTLAQPYSRIDYALAQASTLDGDLILVQPGDYVDESINFLGKQVTVESLGSATDTWISGLGAGSGSPHALVTMDSGENSLSVLRGFTLRNGSGRAGGLGGALYCQDASPTIEQCRFDSNLGGSLGAAVYAVGGGPSFENCWFGGNGGDGPVYGQGSFMRMEGCFFADSAATLHGDLQLSGGGLWATDCFFDGNGAGSGVSTAAMHLSAVDSQILMERCHLRSSTGSSVSGRGMYLESCVSTIRDTTLTNLHPSDVPGGGILVVDGDLSAESVTFTHCATEQGVGGALALVGARAALTMCEFQGNSAMSLEKSGGAIYKWGADNLLVDNCLFNGNQAGEGGAIHVAYGPVTVLGSFFLDNVAMTQGGSQPPARGGALVALGPAFVDQSAFVGNHCRADIPGSSGREALGGALYVGAPGFVRNSLFHENWASGQTLAFGGAIYTDLNGSGTELKRLQLRRNRSQTNPGGIAQGGGVAGSNLVSYCSFIGNEAGTSGGSVLGGTYDHSILSGGIPDEAAGLIQITYSLISSGYAGIGNRSGDPKFWGLDDLHLLPGSQCIDTGDPQAPADLDGTPSDIGAIPFDPKHCGPGCYGEISTEPCLSLPNSTGTAAVTRALGSPGVQDNFVVLFSENLPLGVPGYYLTSPQSGFVPLFGGSEGNLCLGLGILRMNNTILLANAAGQVSRTLDLNNLPLGQTVLPGSSWHYQLWFRDFNGVQSTSNTTSSAQIDFQ
ncbi:MAG: hypothetical protein P1V35_10655 [Planctomycetota bacterium]|nr:hypothetical protein [Planctomycetota bacterium]